MPEIKFDTGLVTYNINGKCEVSFNPTDSAFVERLYRSFEDLDKKQEKYRAELTEISGKKEVFDFARERDEEMRGVIDGLFNAPVCDALFGDMNVYAMSGGLPVWCNFMLAVMDEVDTSFGKEKKLSSAAVQKYTKKYHK